MHSAAAAIASSGATVRASGVTGSSGAYSTRPVWAFFAKSMRTGPGRPDMARRKASRIVGATSLADPTKKLCLVMGSVTPVMSSSWNESVPIWPVETLPVIATSGTESRNAVAMPVTRFVAPGPDVAMQTPTLPVARA